MKIAFFGLHIWLIVLVLNSMIAIALSIFDERSLSDNMVYSHCIGFSIWALSFVRWKWMDCNKVLSIISIPLVVLAGYLLGISLADLVLHNNSLEHLLTQPRRFFGLLLISLAAGSAMSWYFLSHIRLAAERERADTAQRQMTEARLKLLESQLQPHMLFNTLANLHTLIAIDPQAAQTMLDHLTAYLRATLNASRSRTHPLAEEFARLEDYLAVMKIRMGERLHYALHLPNDVREHPIPPLLLQPLVENAIRHGLEPAIAGGRIDVYAARDGNQLRLKVVDTGKGFAPNFQENVGLSHVRERLQTLYGQDSAMNLEANNAGGACVSVELPW